MGNQLLSDEISDEEIAAISMALYSYFSEYHDNESNIITIEKICRPYSPWSSKIYGLNVYPKKNWGTILMLLIACVLLYLAIVKKIEPLLLLPIAFGMLLSNIPGGALYHSDIFAGGKIHWDMFRDSAGLFDYLYLGVKLEIYPCLIFIGVGAMTDFGLMLANPKSLLLGAAAQRGVFIAFFSAVYFGFTLTQAASIGIIGGADGPTVIFLASKLAPEYSSSVFIYGFGACYSATSHEAAYY